MRRAYLLIDLERGQASHVVGSLRDKPGIAFVDAVSGVHDVIIVLEGPDTRAIATRTMQDIYAIGRVRYISACFAIRGQ